MKNLKKNILKFLWNRMVVTTFILLRVKQSSLFTGSESEPAQYLLAVVHVVARQVSFGGFLSAPLQTTHPRVDSFLWVIQEVGGLHWYVDFLHLALYSSC